MTPPMKAAPTDPFRGRAKHFRRKRRFARALREAGEESLADKLTQCQEYDLLAGCSHCGGRWWIPYKCHTRVCPLCSYEETKARSRYILAMLRGMDHPKLMTLTMPTWTQNPRDGIRYIRRAWTKLRRHRSWKGVRGGAYQIELKPKPNGWHIHIHVVFDGPYIPRTTLFAVWAKLTHNRVPQVDIREAGDDRARVYVAKYAAKSAGFETGDAVIAQWYKATKGQRLFATFGRWYNKSLEEIADPDAPPLPPPACPFCKSQGTTYLIRDGPYVLGLETYRELVRLGQWPEEDTRQIAAIAAATKDWDE